MGSQYAPVALPRPNVADPVTLQSAIEAELTFLRAEALGRMTSTVAVKRATGTYVQDEDTGADVPTWDTIYAAAPFRLGGANQGSTGSRAVALPGGDVALATRTGHFPHDHDELRDGDLIDVTAGENAGLVLRVIEATWQDQATARRVQVIEERRPEEWA